MRQRLETDVGVQMVHTEVGSVQTPWCLGLIVLLISEIQAADDERIERQVEV